MSETSTFLAQVPLKELHLRMQHSDDIAKFVPFLCACQNCRLKTEDCQMRFPEVDFVLNDITYAKGCEATRRVNDVVDNQRGAYVMGLHSSCGVGIIDVLVSGTVSYEACKKLKRRILYRVKRSKTAAQKS